MPAPKWGPTPPLTISRRDVIPAPMCLTFDRSPSTLISPLYCPCTLKKSPILACTLPWKTGSADSADSFRLFNLSGDITSASTGTSGEVCNDRVKLIMLSYRLLFFVRGYGTDPDYHHNCLR